MGSYRVTPPFSLTFGGVIAQGNVPQYTGTITATGDMSATSCTTTPVDLLSFETFTFQCVWTGTPTGTIAILGSLDGTNFDNLSASVPGNPAGSAGHTSIPIVLSGMRWLELQYTKTSGSGTLSVKGMGKTR
jgi:hypothetical protein